MSDNNNIEIADKLDEVISQLSLLNKFLFHNRLKDIEDQNSIDDLKMLEILDIDSKKKDHIVDLIVSRKNPLALKDLEKSEIYQTLRDKGFKDKQISVMLEVKESAIRSSISNKKKKEEKKKGKK